jgi:hypothetical protein
MRGQQSLFSSLIDDDTQQSDTPPTIKKGRSEVLIANRNSLLFHRYYYYIKIKEKQYEATIRILERELFITQRTIVDTMSQDTAILRELNMVKPGISHFKKTFPFMVW